MKTERISNRKDLTGKTFGFLKVIELNIDEMEKVKKSGKRSSSLWKCKCLACGKIVTRPASAIVGGLTNSCGCQKANHSYKHNMIRTPVYSIWVVMRQKCNNPKHPSYHLYGGKGVTICDQWSTFTEFHKWWLTYTKSNNGYIKLKEGANVFSPDTCSVVDIDNIISPNLNILREKRFGKLTAKNYIKYIHEYGRDEYLWGCECDCGRKVIVKESGLLKYHKTSCGCNFSQFENDPDLKKKKIRLYNIITHMKIRCYDPSSSHYNAYGGRGISICDEWFYDEEKFIIWALTHGYQLGLTIERIDSNKNYCPENCTWIPMKDQPKNRASNIYYKIGDEIHYISEWNRIFRWKLASTTDMRKRLEKLGGVEVSISNS